MMRILDLRPVKVRLMSRLWGGGGTARGFVPGTPETTHLPGRWAAGVVDGILARRVAGRRPAPDRPAIVSIGNLALGGTGKTPVVGALAQDLAAAGWQGAVLTRGFGSPLAGPLTVDSGNVLAGDEARVLASFLAAHRWPVIQARRRDRGLDHLMEAHPGTEVVIVEDGHQTALLGRHLDVVILDGWTVTETAGARTVLPVTGPVIPFGPWRESAAGADRAGIWLLETDEEMPAEGRGGQPVALFHRKLNLREPRGEHAVDLPVGKVAVLSGIARPEAFEQSLKSLLGREPILAIRCGDHVRYGPRLVERVRSAFQEAGADYLVTTAKDWVKLKPFWPERLSILVADLKIGWGRTKTLPALVGERLEMMCGR